MRDKWYKRVRNGFQDEGRVRSAEDIIQDFVGDRKYYTHYFRGDDMTNWYLDEPSKSNYQNNFASAGKNALGIFLYKLEKAGVPVHV